jgi:hypothetical protein
MHSMTSKTGKVPLMGLFDFLFGEKKSPRVEFVADQLWMSIGEKYAGLAEEITERLNSESVLILLVAHFSDVLQRLNEFVVESGSVPVRAVLAINLSSDVAERMRLDESVTIDIIVAERHPLASADERIVEFAEELPCRTRLSYHLSMEDPFLVRFGGATMKQMFEMFKLEQGESMQSNMLSRRIKKAQQKMERNAFDNSPANSAEEWLEKNYP